MRRALRLAGSLVGLVVIGTMLAALALVFGGRLGAGGQPQRVQQPYPPPQTATAPPFPATPSLAPYPPPATPIPTITPLPPIPTPPLPPTAVVMQTYISRTLIVAPVGSGPGELGVFEMPEMRPIVPHAIALDNEGNIYISDDYNRRVVKYDSEGNFAVAISLNLPISVKNMQVGNDGAIYILEGGGYFIQRIESNGDLSLQYPRADWLESLVSFWLDNAGMLWVEAIVKSDFHFHHAVVPVGNAHEVFSRQRQLDSAIAGYPLGSMVFARGQMSSDGREMQLFDQGGNMVLRLGPFDPRRVTLSTGLDRSGNLYFLRAVITERTPFEVSKFNRKGSLVARFLVPDPYAPPTQPIAIDDTESVYYLLPQKDQVQVIKWERQ